MDEKEALLNQLRDVEVPQVSNVPALGWWLLLLLLLLMVFAYFKYAKRRRELLWQREAEQQLQAISNAVGQDAPVDTIVRCSELARKVVLAVDKREQVAALHGQAWLDKLDAICGRQEFSNGIGQVLLEQPYRKASVVTNDDLQALLGSMKVLLKSAKGYRA